MPKKLSTSDFILNAKAIHGDMYDYSQSVYINTRTKIKIICKKHGEFSQKAGHHLNGSKCPECVREQKTNTKDIFIEKARKVHGDRFDYSAINYINNKTKLKIICPINGEFWQFPNNHLAGYTPFDDKNTKTTSYFINKSQNVHGDKYDYSGVDYKHNNQKVKIICPKDGHGEFWQLPHNHSKPSGSGCPKCNQSQYEECIRMFLSKQGIDFIEKDRLILDGLELDFYIPDYNIAIEIDGLFYHSESNGKGVNYHNNKTVLCRNKGIKLFHFTDVEMKYNFKFIKSFLKTHLDLKMQIGDDCQIKIVDNYIGEKFHRKYNYLNGELGDVNIGLFHKGEILLCLSFNRLSIKNEWKLSYITELYNFYNKAGVSKVLDFFEKEYKPNRLVYKVDNRYGKHPDVGGFDVLKISQPKCIIFKNGYIKTGDTYTESQFDKFDDEYIGKYNWERYWDCGDSIYVKTFDNRHNRNLDELENFLIQNEIDYEKNDKTFSIKDSTIVLKYVDSENHKLDQPKYNINGIHRNYFIDITKQNKEKGIRTIWIKDFEMNYNDGGYRRKWEVLKSYIKSSVGKVDNKYYARDCEIRELSNQEVKPFLERNCFYGYRSSTVILGLFSKKDKGQIKSGELLMVYTFGFPFFSKGKYDIEVIRVATKLNHQILGGASKLLKRFIVNYPSIQMVDKTVDVEKIVFIVDADHNDARSLEKIGFNFVKYKDAGFMNIDALTGEASQRNPMKHSRILEKLKNGEIYMVGNAGSIIYEINRSDFLSKIS